ncbi:hypothetical protein HY497_01625 [Candidatus Woesearchaeota archaeon]|nr:hypothetical protein [Candidatus Woesearchaeota archaeon]
MGLEDVKKKIVEEAERQAKLIMGDADAEIKKIESSAKKEVEEYENQLKRNADGMLNTAERKEHAAAEFEGKRMLLDAKKAALEKVVQEARKRLQKLSSAERKQLVEQLMKKAEREIDVKTVYVNAKDMPAVKGKSVTVVQKDMLGGLIAETDDGKISIDFSFETLLEQIQHEHLREISGVLFP